MPETWTPDSWKAHEARHLPHYEDAAELAEAEKTLAHSPPLVFAGEARALKADLAQVAGNVRRAPGWPATSGTAQRSPC